MKKISDALRAAVWGVCFSTREGTCYKKDDEIVMRVTAAQAKEYLREVDEEMRSRITQNDVRELAARYGVAFTDPEKYFGFYRDLDLIAAGKRSAFALHDALDDIKKQKFSLSKRILTAFRTKRI